MNLAAAGSTPAFGVATVDGWLPWVEAPEGRFHELLGKFYYRVAANGSVETRMDTGRMYSNRFEFLHGGFLMSFVDMAMFAIVRPRLVLNEAAVTLSCATDFLTPGRVGEPIEAYGEVLKETGRMLFVRGLVKQGDANVCSFNGTMRKVGERSAPPAP